MDCPDFESVLLDVTEETASHEVAAPARGHAEACPRCRRTVRAVLATRALLAAHPAVSPPPALVERVLDATRALPRHGAGPASPLLRRRRGTQRALAGLAAGLASLVLAPGEWIVTRTVEVLGRARPIGVEAVDDTSPVLPAAPPAVDGQPGAGAGREAGPERPDGPRDVQQARLTDRGPRSGERRG